MRMRYLLILACLLVTANVAVAQSTRPAIEKALLDGDYPGALELAREGTVDGDGKVIPRPDNWLWLGHACQTNDDWAGAAEAYHTAAQLFGPQSINVWPQLMSWIAQIQSDQLNDPAVAVETLEEMVAGLENELGPLDAEMAERYEAGMITLGYAEPDSALGAMRSQLRLATRRWVTQGLIQLAEAQFQCGRFKDSIATWIRCHEQQSAIPEDSINLDVERVAYAVEHLTAGETAPEIPFLIQLTPEQPEASISLADKSSRIRSFRYTDHGNQRTFAFLPPSHLEFTQLEISCDIEQVDGHSRKKFTCYVRTGYGPHARNIDLGSVGWDANEQGRQLHTETVAVPPGARVVNVGVRSSPSSRVHTMSVKAVFRPVTENPRPLEPGSSIRIEALPAGGSLHLDDLELKPGPISTRIPPGDYLVRYEAAALQTKAERRIRIGIGEFYDFFINLDSPFKWQQLCNTGKNGGPYPTIAKLPDGRSLAAWWGPGGRIMISSSDDLTEWSTPEPAPFNTIFPSAYPSAYAASDGTVWLTYFSGRLPFIHSAYLWLTSTRDGKTWSRPRPIALNVRGGTSVNMTQDADGKCWMFCGASVACGDAFEDIGTFNTQHIADSALNDFGICNANITLDSKGKFHMVFFDFSTGDLSAGYVYCYSSSTDGENWTTPVQVATGRNQPGTVQIIPIGDKMLLLSNGYLLPLTPDVIRETASGIKITGGTLSVTASPIVTDDGEVQLLAGSRCLWLLTASQEDLESLFAAP